MPYILKSGKAGFCKIVFVVEIIETMSCLKFETSFKIFGILMRATLLFVL